MVCGSSLRVKPDSGAASRVQHAINAAPHLDRHTGQYPIVYHQGP